MWQILLKKTEMPTADRALPGRPATFEVPGKHFVNGNRIQPPFPAGLEKAMFGMGCLWGAERKFWEAPGVHATRNTVRKNFGSNHKKDVASLVHNLR